MPIGYWQPPHTLAKFIAQGQSCLRGLGPTVLDLWRGINHTWHGFTQCRHCVLDLGQRCGATVRGELRPLAYVMRQQLLPVAGVCLGLPTRGWRRPANTPSALDLGPTWHHTEW